MVRIGTFPFTLLILFVANNINAQINLSNASHEQTVMTNLSSMPLSFTENQGQFGEIMQEAIQGASEVFGGEGSQGKVKVEGSA